MMLTPLRLNCGSGNVPRNTPGSVAPAVVAYIRQVFDARKAIPSDVQLSLELGISIRMVRAIGHRQRYKSSP